MLHAGELEEHRVASFGGESLTLRQHPQTHAAFDGVTDTFEQLLRPGRAP